MQGNFLRGGQHRLAIVLLLPIMLFTEMAVAEEATIEIEETPSWWQSILPGDESPSADVPQQIQVAEPFVELRTGPASGYPVTHISERGEWLILLKRKTDWMKVRDRKGREGWVAMSSITKSKDGTGELVSIVEPKFDDFETRRWEAGLMFGEFDSTAVNAAYAGYWMTENLSLELWGSQVLGDASELRLLSLNLVHQPFPYARFSPFFTMGGGKLYVDPKSTLTNAEERTEETANVGAGMRFYLSKRYFMRMEVKEYFIFTDREENEEAIEWKIGLSIFF